MKTLRILLVLAAAGLYGTAFAQESVRVAVMDLKARSGIDNMTVSSLTDFVCTTILNAGEYEVIGKDDMQTMMEHIADRQLLECDDTKCLAKIGGALGVQLLVSGNIGMVGKMYLINIKLINIEEATVQNRISEKYMGDETGLVAKVEQSVIKLFAAEGDPGAEPEPEPEPEPVAVRVEPVKEPVHGHSSVPAPAPAVSGTERAEPVKSGAASFPDGRKFLVAPLAGICLSNMSMDDMEMMLLGLIDPNINQNPLIGINTGLRMLYRLNTSWFLMFEPALSQKGAVFTVEHDYYDLGGGVFVDNYYYESTVHLDYVDLMLGGMFAKRRYHLYSGITTGILVNASADEFLEYDYLDFYGNSIHYSDEVNTDLTEHYYGHNISLVIGGGLRFGRFTSDFRISNGLNDITSDEPGGVTTLFASQLVFGWLF